MSKIIDHSTYAPECTCCDDWHTCANCGADKGNLDLWQAYCPRCAELERLEREIGRAMLYEDLANNAAECVMADDGACWILYEAANNAMLATIPLIARWRQLHAADATGEQIP